MARAQILIVLIVAVFVMTLWSPTNAFYTDSSTSQANTFVAAAEFPTGSLTPTPTSGDEEPTPGKIVINEVNPIGGNSADWVELFNAGGTTVDLTGWKIQDNSASPENIPGNFSLAPGDFAVIIGSGSAIAVPESAIKIELSTVQFGSFGLAEDGDRLILLNNVDAVVDSMSYGDDTTILTIPFVASVNTLRRIPNGIDTDAAADWSVGTSSIGVSN